MLYPNPVKTHLNIELAYESVRNSKLFDSADFEVKTFKTVKGLNTYDLSDLKSGLYIVCMNTPDGFLTQKFMKE
jgi:hypothetical protein